MQTGGPQAYIDAQVTQMCGQLNERVRKTGCMQWHPSRLQKLGWYHSRAGDIRSGAGAAQPWLSYAAIDWLEANIRPNWKVLEYGLGSSSLWWAEHVGALTIIEHDPLWIERLGDRLPSWVQLVFIDQADPLYRDYAVQEMAAGAPAWDVISVDGKRRNSVIKRAAKAVQPGGLLLFDDSQKVRYAKPLAKLVRRGFEALDFWDAKPLQSYTGKTTILRAPLELQELNPS